MKPVALLKTLFFNRSRGFVFRTGAKAKNFSAIINNIAAIINNIVTICNQFVANCNNIAAIINKVIINYNIIAAVCNNIVATCNNIAAIINKFTININITGTNCNKFAIIINNNTENSNTVAADLCRRTGLLMVMLVCVFIFSSNPLQANTIFRKPIHLHQTTTWAPDFAIENSAADQFYLAKKNVRVSTVRAKCHAAVFAFILIAPLRTTLISALLFPPLFKHQHGWLNARGPTIV